MRALIIVDMQNDFIHGSLPVPRAIEIVQPIVKLADSYDAVVCTKDWHPADHASFEDQGGSFPPHCVQGTVGAELFPHIYDLNAPECLKGYDAQDVSAMNAFEGKVGLYDLNEYLRGRNVSALTVVGLTGEYCVPATAIGARDYGWTVNVPLAYTKSIADEALRDAVRRMTAAGVNIL